MRTQATIALLALGFVCSLAQTVPPSKPSPPAKKLAESDPEEHKKLLTLWHDRAMSFTGAATDDGWRIPRLRSVLNARLADAWWKIDPQRARPWLEEAIDGVLHSSPKEPEELHKQRLQSAQIVFEIADRYDRENANKILAMLMDEAGKETSDSDSQISSEVANSIFQTAVDSADQNDVQRVEQLGNRLVELHDPGGNLSGVIFQLSIKNPAAAETYFIGALDTAATANDYYSVWDLVQYILPVDSQLPPPSQGAKEQAIRVAGQMLTQVPQNAQQAETYCQAAPLLAERMLPLLPAAQQGLTQAALQNCQNSSDDGKTKSNSHNCDTADDCLARAALATSPEESAAWKTHAARHARHEKDLSRAVDIMLSFTPEEKEADAIWDADYLNFCFEALQQLYKLRDSNKIQQMLDRSPDEVRPGVMLHFAAVLSGNKDVPYATSMLTGARASLEKHAVQNPIVYIELLSLYTRLLPDDAPQALSFAIAGFNQISYPDFEKERAKNKKKLLFRWGKPGERLEPIRIDGAMVDKDEPYVTAALKTVEDPETRIAFRLTFLRYSLKQYEKELNKKPRVSSVKSASAQTVTPK